MPKGLIKTLLIVIVATPLLLVCAFLVAAMFAGSSAGGMLSTGRSVVTHSDSLTLSSTLSSDTATIKTAGKTLVVKPTRLTVDGTIVAIIDEEVSSVEVRVRRGVVTFMADGKLVQTALR